MATLSTLFGEANVSLPVAQAFLRAFDGTVGDFAYLSSAEFDTLLGELRVPPTPPAGEAASTAPPATEEVPIPLRDRTRLRQARDRARTLNGLRSDDAPPGEGAGDSTTPAPTPSKKIKLSSLVDPAAEAELIPLSAGALRDLFARYQQDRGGPPGEEVEPTLEQISAIKQLVDSNTPPYVDFALFGPHGRRFLKKLTYVETIFQVSSGTWVRRELPGPSNYEAWERSWGVFECASILLRIISPERLIAYQTRIRKFVTLYGPSAWPVIYQADVRMRSEHLERLRRRAEIRKDPLLTREAPWDYIFHLAAEDHLFWSEEVQEKAVLLLSRAIPLGRLTGEATLSEGAQSYSGKSEDRGTGGAIPHAHPVGRDKSGQRTKNKGKKAASGPARAPPLSATDKANQICRLFNEGKCQAPCPHGRRHACSVCGGDHPAASCKGRGKERK